MSVLPAGILLSFRAFAGMTALFIHFTTTTLPAWASLPTCKHFVPPGLAYPDNLPAILRATGDPGPMKLLFNKEMRLRAVPAMPANLQFLLAFIMRLSQNCFWGHCPEGATSWRRASTLKQSPYLCEEIASPTARHEVPPAGQ